jgi:hypothetical protein
LIKQLSSPDRNGNPFFEKSYFFLTLQNDQRKFLQSLGKKDFMKKDYNEEQEIAIENKFAFKTIINYKYLFLQLLKKYNTSIYYGKRFIRKNSKQ